MAFSNSKAFSLLELMVTISIMTILIGLGVPAFQDYSQKQAISAVISSLHNDLLMARSQAIFEDVQMVACPGHPETACTGLTDWSHGWFVFADRNEDRTYQQDETLLRQSRGAENMAIHGSAGRSSLRFYPNGSAPGSNSSISFCGLGGPKHSRKLVISNLGRIRREATPGLDASKCP